MKMRKMVCFALCVCLFPAALSARGAEEGAVKEITVYGIKGPSGLGIIRLLEGAPLAGGVRVRARLLSDQNLAAAGFTSGEAAAGVLPPNMAAKIAASGRDVRAAAVIGEGMLSLLSSAAGARGIPALRGGSVEVAGQGATPDYVFRKILARYALVPGRDITLGYSLAYPEIAQSLIAGKVSTALLPEPFATMALAGRPDLGVVADMEEEWKLAGGAGNFPMTLFVVDGVFAEKNAGVVEDLLGAVRDSIEWVKGNPREAGVLAEKLGLGIKASIAEAAIPKSNYVFVRAGAARPALESLFSLFLENAPASIGGSLPPDSFYYR